MPKGTVSGGSQATTVGLVVLGEGAQEPRLGGLFLKAELLGVHCQGVLTQVISPLMPPNCRFAPSCSRWGGFWRVFGQLVATAFLFAF